LAGTRREFFYKEQLLESFPGRPARYNASLSMTLPERRDAAPGITSSFPRTRMTRKVAPAFRASLLSRFGATPLIIALVLVGSYLTARA
jgi:hypothetical protein